VVAKIDIAWRQVFQATWRGLNARITLISQTLRQHRNLVESQTAASQFADFQSHRLATQTEFEAQRKQRQDDARFKVRQWLCIGDSVTRQSEVLKLRHVQTAEWLLHNPLFQRWFSLDHCSDPLLWLTGMPGAGTYTNFVLQSSKTKLHQAKLFSRP